MERELTGRRDGRARNHIRSMMKSLRGMMSCQRVASKCTHRGERVSRQICMWRWEPQGRSSFSLRRRGIDGREIKRGVIKAFVSAAAAATAAAPVRLCRVSAALDKKTRSKHGRIENVP